MIKITRHLQIEVIQVCITSVQAQDVRITELENKIKELIVIPDSLKPNMRFETTSLGGLFLEFNSDISSDLGRINSKHKLSLFIVTSDGFGNYRGDNVTLKVSANSNTIKPRQIKSATSHISVAKTINSWISKNRVKLESYINS